MSRFALSRAECREPYLPSSRKLPENACVRRNRLITFLVRPMEPEVAMAEVVLGVASSHTPQLSTSADYWKEHGARDRRNTRLLGSDGRYRTYDELLAAADPALAGELEPSVWHSKFDRAQAAIEALAQRLARADPDVVVIVGDDQHELFGAEGVPAIGLYTGESLWDLPPDAD